MSDVAALPTTMRAAWYERKGPARDVLTIGEMPVPALAPQDVLVRLRSSGVNPSDVKSRSGIFGADMPFPRVIPHSDGAGEIVAAGSGVPAERVGERVWIYNGQWKRAFGTAAEYIALPASQAVPLSSGTGWDAASCFGIPALTAHRAIHIDGPVAGQTLLVMGGAGAVGHYAIQFAKAAGARVIATVSSPQKAAVARAAGADSTIDYRREHVAERVQALNEQRLVDRVIEVDAGANAHLYPHVLRMHGTVVVYGSTAPEGTVPLRSFIGNSTSLRFFIVYELLAADRKAAIAELNRLLEAGSLRHHIAAEFRLDELAAAHEAVESGRSVGNVVVTFG